MFETCLSAGVGACGARSLEPILASGVQTEGEVSERKEEAPLTPSLGEQN